MPNKHKDERRHHFGKMKFKLRKGPNTTPGEQRSFSDLAIETSLMLGLAFHLPLRQTEGLLGSIFELLKVALRAPDHSTVSRPAMGLASMSKGCVLPAGPVHILIDSTGMVMAASLTDNEVGDPSQVDAWLEQIEAKIVSVMAPLLKRGRIFKRSSRLR